MSHNLRSDLVFGFISIDLQNEKDWKKFKRSQESTPYKIAGFWDAGPRLLIPLLRGLRGLPLLIGDKT